jgi:ketosteroid isomerase-like protein
MHRRHLSSSCLSCLFCLSAALLLAGCTTTTTTTMLPAGNTIKSSPSPKAKKPASASPQDEQAALQAANQQVMAAEQAFAKTMSDRNFQSFVLFLSPEAVFFSGSQVYRGADAVAGAWQQYFVGSQPPFTWRPDHIEVLPSGKLALSTGPVYQNHTVVGRFNSIWRLEAPNTWRIVFDKGEAVCNVLPNAP